jgi:aminoglycoside phosphotransferase (APT) family kinase protein
MAEQESAPGAALDDLDGLMDWPAISAWVERQPGLPGSGPVTSARKLAGGIQNVVMRVERAGAAMILRRPSKRARPEAGETMRREARVLRALAGSAVPHPAFLALCEDEGVTGAVFYLMEDLEGFARSGDLPEPYASDPGWRRAMGEQLVDAAVALGQFDYAAAALADLGKPEAWHERQVERWRRQLEGYAATPGYDPAELPHFREIGLWLDANIPADRRIGLTHGDLQFPNVIFSLAAPRISGIIDWELVTLGDPLVDLGWILSSWLEPGDPPGKRPMVSPWEGFSSRADLVARYCAATGRDPAAVPWFFALACYKLACLLEGTVAASRAGKVPEKVGASIRDYTTWLTTKGHQIISAEGL